MIILTGPIKSGKSTSLYEWTKGRIDIGGFICQINDKELREFYFPSLELKIPFEVDKKYEGPRIEVGPYVFGEEYFQTASQQALEDLSDMDHQWIVIDEIGKLELQDKGFHDLMEIFKSENLLTKNLIFVIRDTLLDQLIEKYQLQQYRVIQKEELKSL